MIRQKLLLRLFSSYFVLVLLAILLLVLFASKAIENFYFDQSVNNLQARAILVDEVLQQKGYPSTDSLQALCEKLGKHTATRITIILPSGQVLADSDEEPENMDLHHDRPEIIAALKGEEGVSRRSSYTLSEEHLYYARLSHNPNQKMVVRVSFPTLALKSALYDLKYTLILSGLLIIFLLTLLNWVLSRQILKPIQVMEAGARRFARGKLKMKVPESNIAELGSLARSLNQMAENIYDRIRVVTQQKNEQIAILSSMSEGVLALGPEGNLLSYNKAAARMFGLQAKSISGRPLHEIIRHTELIDFSQKILNSKKSESCRITVFEPSERILNVIGNRMPAKKGAIGGAVLVFTDLTQIQKLEGVRREFVANVSHELKTPITSIQGYVETLQGGALQDGENAQRFLDIISKHTIRLGQIVDDLLELSRIEEMSEDGSQYLTLSDLAGLIESCLSQFQTAAEARSITLKTELEEGIQISTNAKLFAHALGNLLDNAIKYSEPNSRVIIRSYRKDNQTVLEVSDQGQGIEPEHLDRIFERFYRVDKGRSRDVGGTGLGLSIVKHIARIHHAQLQVESIIGEGSTFRFTFPLDK